MSYDDTLHDSAALAQNSEMYTLPSKPLQYNNDPRSQQQHSWQNDEDSAADFHRINEDSLPSRELLHSPVDG